MTTWKGAEVGVDDPSLKPNSHKIIELCNNTGNHCLVACDVIIIWDDGLTQNNHKVRHRTIGWLSRHITMYTCGVYTSVAFCICTQTHRRCACTLYNAVSVHAILVFISCDHRFTCVWYASTNRLEKLSIRSNDKQHAGWWKLYTSRHFHRRDLRMDIQIQT